MTFAFLAGAAVAALVVFVLLGQFGTTARKNPAKADSDSSQASQVESDKPAAEQPASETSADASNPSQSATASGKDIDYAEVFPSWNPDSQSLTELVDFVAGVTDESSPDYLEPADRVATFDMDGTILCEKAPVYVDYCLTMHRVLDDPTYEATEEERDAMQQVRDHAYSEGKSFHPESLTKDDLVATAFSGMTPEEFRDYVVDFVDHTDVVGFEGMTYGQSFYQPMIEVVKFLQANDFDVWMVSACEREVVRALVERYNIPYDHVVATDVPYIMYAQ